MIRATIRHSKAFCLSRRLSALALLIVLKVSVDSVPLRAQTLTFFSSPQKTWMPSTVGTIPIVFKNSGAQDLLITAVNLVKPIPQLSFYFKPVPILVHPGDTAHVGLSYTSPYSYEYNADIVFTSNDLTAPIKTLHLRINDSVPPDPVRNVKATPGKDGFITISWLPPPTSRDGDPVSLYAIYGRREMDQTSTLLVKTLQTSAAFTPPGDGDFIFAILAYDDMGNRSQYLDSFWTDRTPPKSKITSIDPQTTSLPQEISIGKPVLHVWSEDAHLSEIRISFSDTDQTSPLTEIGRKSGAFREKEYSFDVQWDTRALRGEKDITIYARDTVGNESVTRQRFRINQLGGWPRFALKGARKQSAPLLSLDGGGRLLLSGSDIANGAFRPDGSHYFGRWPLSFDRPGSSAVILSTADADPSIGFETFAALANGKAAMLSYNGATLREFGAVNAASPVVRLISSPTGEIVAAGMSPAVVEVNGQPASVGISASWSLKGEPISISPLFADERPTDRFVIGRLLKDGGQGIVRLSEIGQGAASITLYDSFGSPVTGWPKFIAMNGQLLYPSLGDIDGDGKLDVVAPSSSDSIFVWSADGTPLPGFPISAHTSASGFNQILIADLDGDGAGDLIYPTPNAIEAVSGKSGRPIGDATFPIYQSTSLATMLTIADLNSDGYIEIVESPDTLSALPAWTRVFATNVRDKPGLIQWGTFQHDMKRSGTFETDEPLLHSGVALAPWPDRGRPKQIVVEDKIVIPGDGATNPSYVIYDAVGHEIRTGIAARIDSKLAIDCSELPFGTYSLYLNNRPVVVFQRSKSFLRE